MSWFDRNRPCRRSAQKCQGGSFEGVLFGLPVANIDIVGGVQSTAVASQPQAPPRRMNSPKMLSDPSLYMSVVKGDGTAERKPVRVCKGQDGRPDYAFAAVGGFLTITRLPEGV